MAFPTASIPAGAPTTDVVERFAVVRRRIAAAAARAGREPAAVSLIAVTKGFGPDTVRAGFSAGQVDFGESRAQELRDKHDEVGSGVRWHFVGQLQRNKVRDVVGVATLIHSVDRAELGEAIADRARREGSVQRVLVQVNVGGDPAKAGCAADEAPGLVAAIRDLPHVACTGLMTIPPLDGDPRASFRELRRLRDELRGRYPEVVHLSMGMSRDFEVAAEEGATIVRLGEVLFGPRPDKAER